MYCCWRCYAVCVSSRLLCAAENLRVLTVLSDGNPLYQTFARTFTQNLPADIRATVLQRAEEFAGEAPAADLVVTVGLKAAEWAAGKSNLPMLAVMIPSGKYAEVTAKRVHGSQTSALYIDQSWGRQFALVRAALPERSRVGLLYSADSHLNIDELRKESQRHHVNLIEMKTHSDGSLFDDLANILSRSEVLLAVADNTIYNSNTIRNLLLESYRHSVPLVGFSQSYVNAGALCAVYSTPEQLAAQASCDGGQIRTDPASARCAVSRALQRRHQSGCEPEPWVWTSNRPICCICKSTVS